MMHEELSNLLVQAESRYLKAEELLEFKNYAATLAQRLKIYEFLRDREVAIFQPIAEQLQNTLPQEKQDRLEQCLQQWILTLRHCAMAMLLNDPDYLQQRLLDWLAGLVKTHQTQQVESIIYELLIERLNELLSPKAMVFLQPFFDQVRVSLLDA